MDLTQVTCCVTSNVVPRIDFEVNGDSQHRAVREINWAGARRSPAVKTSVAMDGTAPPDDIPNLSQVAFTRVYDIWTIEIVPVSVLTDRQLNEAVKTDTRT